MNRNWIDVVDLLASPSIASTPHSLKGQGFPQAPSAIYAAAIARTNSFAWTIMTTNHAVVRKLPIRLLTLMM